MKKKTVKKSPKKEKLETKLYHLTIEIAGDIFDFETNDLVKSLLDFPNPMSVKSKVMIKVSKGEQTFEKMFLPRLARRYFTSPNFAAVLSANIQTLLG